MPSTEEGSTAPPGHIELADDNNPPQHHGGSNGGSNSGLRDSKGWDGKLRIPKSTLLSNPEALSDPEYSDDDNVVPGEELAADEGESLRTSPHLQAHVY